MDIQTLEPRATEAANLMRALANAHRLLIMCQLHQGEHSVGALAKVVGLSQSALSQHLATLRRDRLVATRREGQTIYYSLASAEVMQVIALLYRLYCDPHCGNASERETSNVD